MHYKLYYLVTFVSIYMRSSLLALIFFIGFLASAQQSIPVGQWRSHLPYNSVLQMIESPQKIYVRSEIGLYSFHKKSGELQVFTKVNGYSGTHVTAIEYSDSLSTLVVAYKDGNVDLVKEDRIVNIQGIYRKLILGKKEINEIQIFGQLAYLATSFGVVVIDLVNEEIKDSYLNIGEGGSNLEVLSVQRFGNSLYLGSYDGIYTSEIDPSVNLSDFASWNHLRLGNSAQFLRSYNGQLFFIEDSLVYTFDGSSFNPAFNGVKRNYKSLSLDHGKLVVCSFEEIIAYDGEQVFRQVNERFKDFAILDHEDNIWCGGFYTGMVKIAVNGAQSSLRPQGPFGPGSFEMAATGTRMWVTGGGHSSTYSPTFTNYGYYYFDKGMWTSRPTGVPGLSTMYDFTSIVIDPFSGDIWMGTHGTGLCHLNQDGEFIERLDHTNTSAIQSDANGFDYVLGLAMDDDQNLWFTNFESKPALSVRYKDGTIQSFDVGETRLGEMVIDRFGQKWICLEREAQKGILVFKESENGGIEDMRILSNVDLKGALPNNTVNALAIDKDGEIWVGTESGLAIFYNSQLVFDPEQRRNADAQQMIVDDGQDRGYLLGTEVINDIKIDGANRKWIATNNGVWLVKADASAVIAHYTIENSPLPSNVVQCVGVEPVTGEVFIGTTGGIVSFRGDATEAPVDVGQPLVFPNPVHKNYDGPITITGLPENASVTITDIAGRVVYEMVATGGTAVWNGRNFNGERPYSGVYLIFTSDEDDEESLVSKLLIVR